MKSTNFKRNPFAILILAGIIFLFLNSCVEDDEFRIPELSISEPDVKGTVISPVAINGLLSQAVAGEGENATVTFQDSDNYMTGYVISDDRTGNFFEELIVQDAAQNPQGGIRILIDVNPLFTTYEFGQKIFIKLDGLSAGLENGMPTLGILDGERIAGIPSFSQNKFIIRSSEVAEIVPLKTTIPEISDQLLNVFVELNKMQFEESQVMGDRPFTFAAEPSDQFNGERILQSCKNNSSMLMSTSTFCDFRGLQLPKQKGSIRGILNKNFFGDLFTIRINDPSGLIFEDPNRCKITAVDCDGEITPTVSIFNEDFTNKTISELQDEGWIIKNTSGGSLSYKIGDFNTNQYAEISAFGSGENIFDVWLISPEIDTGSVTEKAVSFLIQANFDNGTILTPLITNSFTGDIQTTEWMPLDTAVPKGPSSGFGEFTTSGNINISCIEGKIRLGFRYSNVEVDATTRYHIDNILITGN